MNIRFLIDRVVQENAVLLAELATAGGMRAPLAELSDQLFIHLADELDRRGVSRKVSADMFGMAQRAYLKKIQRLAKSSTDRGSSLWLAVLEFLLKQHGATRTEVLQKFCRDDEAQLKAVLFDLVESGLVELRGSGNMSRYEIETLDSEAISSVNHFGELLWLIIYGDGPMTHQELVERSHRRATEVEEALRRLVAAGKVTSEITGDEVSYRSSAFVRPVGANAGWEAAILDHYRAMVKTLVQVLPELAAPGQNPQRVNPQGGYTYAFDIWPEHPLEKEVNGSLSDARRQLSDLRKRVDATNQRLTRPPEIHKVVIYGGQSSQLHEGLES
ncbi:MAG: hypothetical protein MK135_09465 [Polyangiaceae bacterium]|nr:hypothetical protein [Polyangiaceae bacterium]